MSNSELRRISQNIQRLLAQLGKSEGQLEDFLAANGRRVAIKFLAGADVNEIFLRLVAEFLGCNVAELTAKEPIHGQGQFYGVGLGTVRARMPRGSKLEGAEAAGLFQAGFEEIHATSSAQRAPYGECPRCRSWLEMHGNCPNCNFYTGQ